MQKNQEMTKRSDKKPRIVIAVTELAPVHQLWSAALKLLAESRAELLAVFITDDRWHRAASLPFTREISRISGMDEDFTARRAIQVHDEAIHRTQIQIQELASRADLKLVFEVLAESDQQRVRELVTGSNDTLIAPSVIGTRPLFEELRKLGCRIVLIETRKETYPGPETRH